MSRKDSCRAHHHWANSHFSELSRLSKYARWRSFKFASNEHIEKLVASYTIYPDFNHLLQLLLFGLSAEWTRASTRALEFCNLRLGVIATEISVLWSSLIALNLAEYFQEIG